MSWRSVGYIAAEIIARHRRGETITAAAKIRTLSSRGEIDGWREEVARSGRAWEPGELHALAEQERKLG